MCIVLGHCQYDDVITDHMMSHDVTGCRLVSERTVEENILKKANQKKMLGNIAIEGGTFTTDFFKKVCSLRES